MEPLRILYVDDNNANLMSAFMFFDGKEGVSIDCCRDVESAKKKIDNSIKEGKPYYVGLFDLQMPDKEGKTGPEGLKIYKYALEKGVLSYILTQGGHHGHGDATSLKNFMADEKFSGTKSDDSLWNDVFNYIKNESSGIKKTYDSLERFSKHNKEHFNFYEFMPEIESFEENIKKNHH